MTQARRWRVGKRYDKNKAKPKSEAALQALLAKWLESPTRKVLVEVDRGRSVTDVLTLGHTGVIGAYECKGKGQSLQVALKQLRLQSANVKYVVCPERKIREKTQQAFEAEGVGLLYWLGGGFNLPIRGRIHKMSKRAYERALAHFKEVENEER